MADFFSSRDIELPEDTSVEEQSKASDKLYALCISDVEKDVENFRKSKELGELEPDWSEVIQMINSFSIGNPVGVGDFSKLVEGSLKSNAIQAVKRAYNRSPLAQERKTPRELKGDFKEESHNHATKIC